MTTKVTVDAHAGWPVNVTIQDRSSNEEEFKSTSTEVVAPMTIKDFHVTNTRRLIVEEAERT